MAHFLEIDNADGDLLEVKTFCSDFCHQCYCDEHNIEYRGWNGAHELESDYPEWCERCLKPLNFEAEISGTFVEPFTYLWPVGRDDPVWGASMAQLGIARDWHNGQASMLYAISSSDGWLRFGTSKPVGVHTYRDWARTLLVQLRTELADVHRFLLRMPPDREEMVVRVWLDELDSALNDDDD